MSHIDEVRQTLLDRISELESDLELARKALAALDGSQTGSGTARRLRRRVSEATGNGAKPESKTGPAGKLTMLLANTQDGLGTEALAKQTGGDRLQILTLLKELEADGKVSRSGQRRATRWHIAA